MTYSIWLNFPLSSSMHFKNQNILTVMIFFQVQCFINSSHSVICRLKKNPDWLTSQLALLWTLLHKRLSAFRLHKAKPCWPPLPAWTSQPGRGTWGGVHEAKTRGGAGRPDPTHSPRHRGGQRGCVKTQPQPPSWGRKTREQLPRKPFRQGQTARVSSGFRKQHPRSK